MRYGSGARWAGTASVLAAAIAATALVTGCGWLGPRSSPGIAADRDIAVVLLAGPDRLVSVDLVSGDMLDDVPLRSLSLDMAADASAGVVFTAQCGGVAQEADDVVGLYRPRRGGGVSYVTLPAVNPGLVTVGEGKAYVEHGLETTEGLVLSVLDVDTGSVVGTGTLPSGPGGTLAWAAGRLHVIAVEDGPESASTLRLASSDDAGRDATRGPELRGARGVAQGGGSPLVFGRGKGPSGEPDGAWVWDLAAAGQPFRSFGRLVSADVACATEGWIAAGYWGGDEPTPGRSRVEWIDRISGRSMGSLASTGGICALKPWGDRLVMLERDPCRLVVVDTATGVVLRAVPLGKTKVLLGDLEVLPGERPGAR